MVTRPFTFKTSKISEDGTVHGLASTFGGEADDYGDTIAPGAFKGSLAAHAKSGTRVVMLRDHDPSQVVGRWESINETPKGLEVIGKLTLAVEKARETLALMKDGAMTGLSIGFRTIQAAKRNGVRVLEKIDLREISIVAIPANTSARILAVKAEEIGDKREFEAFLRDAGWSRERAKVLAKGFRPASSGQRDADLPGVRELAQQIKARAEAIASGRGIDR